MPNQRLCMVWILLDRYFGDLHGTVQGICISLKSGEEVASHNVVKALLAMQNR